MKKKLMFYGLTAALLIGVCWFFYGGHNQAGHSGNEVINEPVKVQPVMPANHDIQAVKQMPATKEESAAIKNDPPQNQQPKPDKVNLKYPCKPDAEVLSRAEKGDAAAQIELWRCFSTGQDYAQAFKWIKLAADKGNVDGQFFLAGMYAGGAGVERNFQEEAKYYKLAAAQGKAAAQFNMGILTYNGQGVQQDFREAAKWYALAAEQGQPTAQLNLGEMYLEGKGVKQDYAEAKKWLQKASNNGIKSAADKLRMIK